MKELKNDYFVVGDIHGHLEKLELLLTKWNPKEQQLVFLGDYVDRGPNAKGVLKLVQKLVKEEDAVAIMGNHESMLIDWAHHPEKNEKLYLMQGGLQTLESFGFKGYDSEYLCEQFHIHSGDTLPFLKSLTGYFETQDYLFVHAGVNLDIDDWRQSNPVDFQWIRSDFHHSENNTGKIIIFGHTPTRKLNVDGEDHAWMTRDAKVGIDGGVAFGGNLIGMLIASDKWIEYHVTPSNTIEHHTFNV